MNGTSCATFSLRFLVIHRAPPTAWRSRLVFESPCSARIMAAKFTPVAAMRLMPKVVPGANARVAATGRDCRPLTRAATRFTPPTGCWKAPDRDARVAVFDHTAQFTPSSAFLLHAARRR